MTHEALKLQKSRANYHLHMCYVITTFFPGGLQFNPAQYSLYFCSTIGVYVTWGKISWKGSRDKDFRKYSIKLYCRITTRDFSVLNIRSQEFILIEIKLNDYIFLITQTLQLINYFLFYLCTLAEHCHNQCCDKKLSNCDSYLLNQNIASYIVLAVTQCCSLTCPALLLLFIFCELLFLFLLFSKTTR